MGNEKIFLPFSFLFLCLTKPLLLFVASPWGTGATRKPRPAVLSSFVHQGAALLLGWSWAVHRVAVKLHF